MNGPKNFTKIDLDRTKGLPFFMAFCYLPKETLILTGDLVRIRDYACTNLPTHHAAVIGYRNKKKLSHTYIILGKGCNNSGPLSGYWLRKISHKKHDRFRWGAIFKSDPEKRSGWVLHYTDEHVRYKTIRFYRKMPKQYLNIFKELGS